jgi:hypothetical protein
MSLEHILVNIYAPILRRLHETHFPFCQNSINGVNGSRWCMFYWNCLMVKSTGIFVFNLPYPWSHFLTTLMEFFSVITFYFSTCHNVTLSFLDDDNVLWWVVSWYFRASSCHHFCDEVNDHWLGVGIYNSGLQGNKLLPTRPLFSYFALKNETARFSQTSLN